MADSLPKWYNSCTDCPRNCGVNRNTTRGFCRETEELQIAWAGLHFGEEPPITAQGGSGTLFITGCNLRCIFCQNFQISLESMGAVVSSDEFSQICLKLQKIGAENINIVTGSHAIPLLADYLREAKKNGLCIPVCWNSSAYETPQALSLLDGIADIWLPDLKTLNPLMSKELFAAADYPIAAKKAIRFMVEHSPLRFARSMSADGTKQKLLSGVIIRHLILPGRLDDTKTVLDWLHAQTDGRALISLMTQYTPVQFTSGEEKKRQESLSTFAGNRFVNKAEFDAVQNMIAEYGFDGGFYQELTQDSSWLPDFTRTQPFSSELAKPVWHWRTGFI